MALKMVIQASEKYRNAVESEAKAPRKIILWLIALEIIEVLMVGWLFYKSIVGG